jgi:hypothetical protein
VKMATGDANWKVYFLSPNLSTCGWTCTLWRLVFFIHYGSTHLQDAILILTCMVRFL